MSDKCRNHVQHPKIAYILLIQSNPLEKWLILYNISFSRATPTYRQIWLVNRKKSLSPDFDFSASFWYRILIAIVIIYLCVLFCWNVNYFKWSPYKFKKIFLQSHFTSYIEDNCNSFHNLVMGRRKCQQRKARPSFRGSCDRDSCSFHKDYVTQVVKAVSKTSNSFLQNRRRLNE